MVLENASFYLFYWVSLFALEERLWEIVSASPVAVLRGSWFASRAFVPLHLVAWALFFLGLPLSASELRRHCLGEWRCRRRLGEDVFGHLDVNDGQWRSFRQQRCWRFLCFL